MSHNAFFHLSFRLDINCSCFITVLHCSVCTVCTLQACFCRVLGASEPAEVRLLSSSKHRVPPRFVEAICIIYLVVPKLFVFSFTTSLKCSLGSTYEHNLALLSISPVSYLHTSTEVKGVPILCWARWDKMWESCVVCKPMAVSD